MPEAVIIGSGLGGMLCGAILSLSGWRVTILEKGAQCGGCLQSFVRDGLRFDPGFHSVAGLESGGPLEKIFRPLGLMSLPWEFVPESIINPVRLSYPTDKISAEEYRHVMEPYLKGSWRLPTGELIIKHLKSLIRGEIRTRCEVTDIEPGLVRCKDGSTWSGTVISDIHPCKTFELFRGHVRPAYLRRLRSLENGPGIYTVYCKLHPGTVPYQPLESVIDGFLMLHYGNPDGNGFARSLDLLTYTPLPANEGETWAEALIRHVPNLEESVEKYWTSTPSTWERYTGTPGGSAYGIRKKDATCYVHPRTPVPGLFLTGQNCGLHGVLGVAETALLTCREILGEETLNQIFDL